MRHIVCKPCRDGHHPHDKHTGLLPGAKAGDDAGCPNVADPSDPLTECRCEVRLSPANGRRTKHCPTCRCAR